MGQLQLTKAYLQTPEQLLRMKTCASLRARSPQANMYMSQEYFVLSVFKAYVNVT